MRTLLLLLLAITAGLLVFLLEPGHRGYQPRPVVHPVPVHQVVGLLRSIRFG